MALLHRVQQRRSGARLVAALVATGALAAAGGALAAPGDVIQTLDAAIAPSKLPESDLRSAELQIQASACFEGPTPGQCRPESPQIPDLERMLLSLDRKDVAVNAGAANECKASPDEIADESPGEAAAACGNGSVVGSGQAAYNLGQSNIPADVTVFNGRKQGGRPVVLLHAYAPQFQQGTVSVGVLKPKNKLDVTIDPLIPNFSRLASIDVQIKKGSYVQARCSRGKEIETTSRWTYRDAPEATVPATQRCRVKR